ncbi:unnamed protein product [Symbiodinium sp. CCMP2592]|nr:unnamed protein product [Symbiodinium sp. CCMP2592]
MQCLGSPSVCNCSKILFYIDVAPPTNPNIKGNCTNCVKLCYKITFLQVQELAEGAVSWCSGHGGRAPKKDIISKMAKLGGRGKHAQNAERDLQTAIRIYGRALGCKIENCEVRMWDPRDNVVVSVQLPVLFPDSLARAIWKYNPEVFENMFLGPGGANAAKLFWDNAKRNCPWYPPNVKETEHAGLIPLSLYGDDVQAYRNSDPGAISAIGWCSDFGRGNEAFLHYMLCTVFSEYCACEHTYRDLMQALLPRFHDMCEVDPQKNPWCSRGLRFVLTGVQGDLKWLLTVSGKVISFWLASRCMERGQRDGASDVEKLVALCTQSYASMLKMMDEAPLVMSRDQADRLYDAGIRHLQTYARLRALSAEVTRGKTPNRSSWTILPKHHHLWHALHQARDTLVNLNGYNLLAAESWVGLIGRMARTAHRTTVSLRTIQRYQCFLRMRLVKLARKLGPQL